MMEHLIARVRADVEEKRRALVARLTAAARDEVPRDVTVEQSDEGVVLSGWHLAVRGMRDARLRAFAALARMLS